MARNFNLPIFVRSLIGLNAFRNPQVQVSTVNPKTHIPNKNWERTQVTNVNAYSFNPSGFIPEIVQTRRNNTKAHLVLSLHNAVLSNQDAVLLKQDQCAENF